MTDAAAAPRSGGAEPEPPLWPTGSATGVGSLPGTDIRAATGLVLDTLSQLPHVPELPGRGPGSELTGRTLALMADIAVQWGTTGWTVADRQGRDHRRAAAFLDEDLDVLEEMLQGWSGSLKAQVCGPWTLAATVELRSGRPALSDPGAVRDMVQALAEAAAAHCADLRRRVPGAQLLVQLDEPALTTVLRGELPTPSGLATIAAVDEPVVEQALHAVVEAVVAGGAIASVHVCAAAPPVELLARAGFRALSLDAGVLTRAEDDPIATAVEAGTALLLGLVSTVSPPPEGPNAARTVAAPARALWQRTGLALEGLAAVAVTPSCGLAGATLQRARDALSLAGAAARTLVEDPQDDGRGRGGG